MGDEKQLGMLDAIAIGIGGMIGAGIFSILGLAAIIAGHYVYISFLVAGGVAALCAYSYAKLGARYPSSGGPVEYLVRGFGDNVFTGGLNIMLWMGYMLALALYAAAFGYYLTAFFPQWPGWAFNAAASGIIILFTAINVVGAKAVGRSEIFIVAVKVGILLLFIVMGLLADAPSFTDPGGASLEPAGVLFASGMVFISYEGFGLISNTAGDMKDVKRTLPVSLYVSVAVVIVIYVLVSLVLTNALTGEEIAATEEHALAEAARPFLGAFGFKLIGIAALFSTASAINATLFGGANVSYTVAKHGGLPEFFTRRMWGKSEEGLFITSAIVLLFVNLIDLGGIAMLGSASFLILYMLVCVAHLRLKEETGGWAPLIVASIIGCAMVLVILCIYIFRTSPLTLVLLVAVNGACFLGEWLYRRFSNRTFTTTP